jgi:diguanylate cyclase (GGDEF)-like protein
MSAPFGAPFHDCEDPMFDNKKRDPQESERLLLNAAGDAAVLLDRGASIVSISDATLMLLGQPAGSRALVTEPFFKMICADDAQAVRDAFRTTVETGNRTRANGRLQDDPAGQWFDWQFSRYDSAQGTKSPILAVARDATDAHQLETALRYDALHDKLTGLPNRALFSDRLQLALEQARRAKEPLGVLLLDLDGFKKVNDSMGHMVGDTLLQVASHRMAGALREGDTLARFGGDEFVVLLPGARHETDLHTVARRILVALQPPFEMANRKLYVSGSIGGALYPRDGSTEDTLLAAADMAMYQAKGTKGGCCVVFDGSARPDAKASVALEEGMHQAISEGQFLLHFQPLIGAQSRQVEGFEALMRWERPGHGLVSPADFIPLAEANGLITLLGTWALKAACMQAQRFSKLAGRPLSMSVNVSPRQFRSTNFVEAVQGALALSELPPTQLVLEVTEGILMDAPAHAARILSTLADRGVRVAIDDFGTGYCSLAYLKSLPVNSLKIDRSFVTGLPAEAKDAAICRSVLGLARELGLSCTAEGIETPEQRQFLTENGCTFLQGYLEGRPVPAEQITALLTRAA